MDSPIFLVTILRTLMNTYMPPSELAIMDATYMINQEARNMMPMPSIAARNGKSHDGIVNEKLSNAKKVEFYNLLNNVISYSVRYFCSDI